MRFKVLHLLLLVLLAACSAPVASQGAIVIDLHRLAPLPTPEQTTIEPLRVAIAAIISPEGTVDSYTPLLNYLEANIGRPIEVEQRRTYAEVNELLKNGEVDLAFVCTSSYLVGRREFDLQILVVPRVNGEIAYHSQFIVPSNSRTFSIEDLEGQVFAFTDPLSFTGRIYPTYFIQSLGIEPENHFSRTFFTYSHDEAIYAVADGIADGAAVDSLVLDFAFQRDPGLRDKLRIIHTSPGFGIPPVVFSSTIRPQQQLQLQEVFLDMHNFEEGRAALEALDYDSFTVVDEDIYASAEEIELSVDLK